MRKVILLILILFATGVSAQELNAKVTINHAKISNTKDEVFTALQTTMQNFLNEHKWTNQSYRESERISCSFNITVNEWNENESSFKCSLLMSAVRPVFNSTYNTTLYSVNDGDFNFSFQTTDQIEWNPDYIDNNLVALLAYYAYMIIGYDQDAMAPMGGTSSFQTAEQIVNTAQNIGYSGWASFNEPKNRFGLLNDYIDGSMEDYRKMIYQYHRQGLDQMADNQETGRNAIVEAIQLLDASKSARTMSHLPQLFSEYKRDELVNIFQDHGTADEKNSVADILSNINASQSEFWDKIRK